MIDMKTTHGVNEPFLRRVLAHIEDNQHRWDQADWIGRNECGTTFCLAGWAYVLSTGKFTCTLREWYDGQEGDLFGVAQEALGLTQLQADDLFLYMDVEIFDRQGNSVDVRHPTFSELCDQVQRVTGVRYEPREVVVPVLEAVPV